MTRRNSYVVASLLAIGASLPAFGQTAGIQAAPSGPQTGQADSARDVVVVTANKREETVQDIAVAVTAISSEQKEELGIISVTDLTNVTPGLSYTPGNERVTLRGVGRLTNNFGADPGVANYNDGIYTAFAVFAGKDPLLIDRVEVLRGPQGTLYGRNSIGGAINTISKRPTDTFRTDIVLGAGSFDHRKLGGAVSGPITDWLRYRVAGLVESREGIDQNYGTGETEGWEIDDSYIEAQLEGDIGDRFTWWLKVADLNYDKAGPPGGRTATFSTAPYLRNVFAGGTAPIQSWAYGTDPSLIGFTQTGTRRDVPFATNREHAYNLNYASTAVLPAYDEYVAEAVYSAGPFDIKYMGGYVYYNYELYSDPDSTPIKSITYNTITQAAVTANSACRPLVGLPNNLALYTGATRTLMQACSGLGSGPKTIQPGVLNKYRESRSFYSNELDFISTTDGPLQWIGGLYAYSENSDQPGQETFLPDDPAAVFFQQPGTGALVANPTRRTSLFRNTSLQFAYGAFGQADYSPTEKWKGTLGLRYSYDTKKFAEEAFQTCFVICRSSNAAFNYDLVNLTQTLYGSIAGVTIGSDGIARRRLANEWSAVTGTAGLEFRPVDDTLLFAKYSKGYKAGGFNASGMALLPNTNKETVNSYEGGWKQEIRDWGLTTNTAVFYYDYKDTQAPLTTVLNPGVTGLERAFTSFVNLPEVTTWGVEVEGNWSPIDPLNIGFSYSYLSAEIGESPTFRDPSRPAGDPLRDRTLNGNKLAQSPEHKVSLNVAYRMEFENGATLTPTLSYYWRDEFYDGIFNNDLEKSPAYDQTDARMTWRDADDRWTFIAWARNLFDEEQTTSISVQNFRTQDLGRYQTWSFAPPRMVGVELQFHYK
jgi:iron complex outermembrane recepter protein